MGQLDIDLANAFRPGGVKEQKQAIDVSSVYCIRLQEKGLFLLAVRLVLMTQVCK